MGGNDLRDDSFDNREFANLAYGLRIADFNRRFERSCLRDPLRSILLGWFIYRPVMHVRMLRIAFGRTGFYLESLIQVRRGACIPATYETTLSLAGYVISPNPDFTFL